LAWQAFADVCPAPLAVEGVLGRIPKPPTGWPAEG